MMKRIRVLSNSVLLALCGEMLTVGHLHAQSVRVPGFLPSTRGLHFVNYFSFEFIVDVAGVRVDFGGTPYGLCGGMAFTVRDYFDSGWRPPCDTATPSSGPLFDHLWQRQIDSLNLPGGPLTYFDLMTRPLHQTSLFGVVIDVGTSWIMVVQEWPKIQSDLDSGRLSPLGLIRSRSANPADIVQNHQVLAYGYDLNGTDLRIYVYDSDHPNEDDVTLHLDISNPTHTTPVDYTLNGTPVDGTTYCFFHDDYGYATPPYLPDVTPPTIFCPANMTVSASPSSCSAPVNYPLPFASDACSPPVTVQCNPASGSVFPRGTSTVNCSATDAVGNVNRCSFNVTVVDVTPPGIACPTNITVAAPVGSCSVPVSYPLPSVSELCSLPVTVRCNPPSGSTFVIGTTQVVCTATDAAGNTSRCGFTVTVAGPSSAGGIGLLGSYYDQLDIDSIQMSRLEAVDFAWGTAAPIPGMGPNTFRVRWTGQVVPRYTDTYNLFVKAYAWNGVRLLVDGQPVIDVPPVLPSSGGGIPDGYLERQGTAPLVAGRHHEIALEFIELTGPAAVTLSWSSTCQPKEVIPVGQLFPSLPPCPVVEPKFTAGFTSGIPAGMKLFGNATVDGGYLKLTAAQNGQYGIAYIDDFSNARPVHGFRATFKASLFGSTCCGNGAYPADGFSFNLVPAATVLPNPGYGQPGEEGLSQGLTVEFDTFDNGGGEGPAIDLKWLGQEIAHQPFQPSQSLAGITDPAAAARDVVIDLEYNGLVSVSYGGQAIFTAVPTPYNPAQIGVPKWVIGARTGWDNDNQWLAELQIVVHQDLTGLTEDRLLPPVAENGQMVLYWKSQPCADYCVECTTDFRSWLPLPGACPIQAGGYFTRVVDTTAPARGLRFYRLQSLR